LIAIGIAAGLAISFGAVRLLERQIWNVSPFDPISFATAALLTAVVGLKASFWPAWRAARIDPVRALKYE
jgi:ABC-type antimicrobial peptide transport system permease subunit